MQLNCPSSLQIRPTSNRTLASTFQQPRLLTGSLQLRVMVCPIPHRELAFGHHHTPDHPALVAVLMICFRYLEINTNLFQFTTSVERWPLPLRHSHQDRSSSCQARPKLTSAHFLPCGKQSFWTLTSILARSTLQWRSQRRATQPNPQGPRTPTPPYNPTTYQSALANFSHLTFLHL